MGFVVLAGLAVSAFLRFGMMTNVSREGELGEYLPYLCTRLYAVIRVNTVVYLGPPFRIMNLASSFSIFVSFSV
ncbi:hypothetical protein GGR50DRAFT_652674 [Xylaria sp. CBS 124048]|nr:hypothetical protein GGR50DRAFT_652674 [Xylaria sp. CBS 124048]